MKSFAPATLLLLSALFLLPGLGGKNSPGQGDEVMHLLTVQSSLEYRSYLIPVIEGQPNYYKPPLLFWAAMATEQIFGEGLFGGRLPSVIFTAACALVMYFILLYARMDWRVAFASALAYILTVGAMKFARLLMMEQGMAFSLLLIVLCLVAQIQTGKLRYALLSGLVTGAAFLFKGPLFIVYTGLIYSVWIMIPLFRFRTADSSLRWRGKRYIALAAKTAALVLAGSVFLPLLWTGSILAFSGQVGAALLEYFFVVENFGKFAQDNQNTLRLLGGWLTYTFPWTLIVLAGMFFVFVPQRMQSRRQYFGRILILSVFIIMVFHVLPHRKAAYYGIPFMPFVFVGIPLLIMDLASLERPARWTIYSFYIISPVLAFAAVAGSESWAGLLLLVPALPALFLDRVRLPIAAFFSSHKNLKIAGVSGALMILSLQFVLYPLLNHEVIPPDRVGALAKNVCVVTGETWDAMDLKVQRRDLDVVATVPMSPDTCVDGRRAVLHIPDAPTEESKIDLALEARRYEEKFRWNMWSRRLDTNAIIDYLQGGRRILSRVRYYEPAK